MKIQSNANIQLKQQLQNYLHVQSLGDGTGNLIITQTKNYIHTYKFEINQSIFPRYLIEALDFKVYQLIKTI